MTERPDWQRAFEMLGTDGTDLIPILLAADGSMYAVLQGEYAGALRTVKLDDQGRISAFIIDSTDAWGQMLSIGNAELAVRLGSPVVYEQSGRVQFIETFEQGLRLWQPTFSGLGAAATVDPVYPRTGGYSAKLTGGSTLLKYAQLSYVQGIASIAESGIAFAYSSATDFESITMIIDQWDLTTRYGAGIKLDGDTDRICILDHEDNWQEIISANPQTFWAGMFHFLKITYSPGTGFYDKLKFNQDTEDISAYQIQTEIIGARPMVQLTLRLTSKDDENAVAYFDDIILTTAESI